MMTLAVELKGVNRYYPHFNLTDIDLELPDGHVMGFIGPNGAGKSTTINLIMGMIHQDSGQVKVLGQSMPGDQSIAKKDIGFVSEDMRLYGHASLRWHMDFIKSIYPSWDEEYAKRILKRFDLISAQKIKGFSHGQRVKAALLLVLSRHPKLLVLDEPTTGLDPVARNEVLGELMEVLVDEERTILFSSHNTQDVEQISDLITFIDRGRLIDSMDKEGFLDQWRRIRLEVPDKVELPTLTKIVNLKKSGRLAAVTTNGFNSGILDAYNKAGATVKEVENMTLEEIFVANVQKNREEEAQA